MGHPVCYGNPEWRNSELNTRYRGQPQIRRSRSHKTDYFPLDGDRNRPGHMAVKKGIIYGPYPLLRRPATIVFTYSEGAWAFLSPHGIKFSPGYVK